MTKDDDTNGVGDNSLPATQEAIRRAFETMDKLEEQRASINAKLLSERKNLYANHGVTVSALARARTLAKMNDDKREVEQLAVAICESAMGIAQEDLFDNLQPLPIPEKRKPGRPRIKGEAAQAPA